MGQLRIVRHEEDSIQPSDMTAKRAAEIDAKVRESVSDFIEVGRMIMEFRDGRGWLHLDPPLNTFEEWLKDRTGYAASSGQELVRLSLIGTAIKSGTRHAGFHPTYRQMMVLERAKNDGASLCKFLNKRGVHRRLFGDNEPYHGSDGKAAAEIVEAEDNLLEMVVTEFEKRKATAASPEKFHLTGAMVARLLPPLWNPGTKVAPTWMGRRRQRVDRMVDYLDDLGEWDWDTVKDSDKWDAPQAKQLAKSLAAARESIKVIERELRRVGISV